MNKLLILKNQIQEYSWGSRTAIQNLLGQPPSEEPWAELWMGAHPKAPSQVFVGNEWVPLNKVIDQEPDKILGKNIARKFNNTLPYLFKILAADQPLSIQAHPNLTQAEIGYKRENDLGISLSAPDRNYRDPQHKPEYIVALTPFIALKGFRTTYEIIEMLEYLCPVGMKAQLNLLKEYGLKPFFQSTMELSDSVKESVINEAVTNAKQKTKANLAFDWIQKLYSKYPQDIGILSPAILNLITLKPEQALFLPAGELHAYLDGLGIELMANSDNVLRGGLTPKHIDLAELMEVLNFNESGVDIILPETLSAVEKQYPVFADEFALSIIKPAEDCSYVSSKIESVEILLCTDGESRIETDTRSDFVTLSKGESILVPGNMGRYKISGNALIFKASVPI